MSICCPSAAAKKYRRTMDKVCPTCRHWMPVDAAICPECSHKNTPVPTTRAEKFRSRPGETRRQTMKRKKVEDPEGYKKDTRVAMILSGVVVLIVVIAAGINDGGSQAPPTTVPAVDHGSRAGAEVACERFVERQLKAPSTAKYKDRVTVQGIDKSWTVTGNVDAQNSFGAMIRNGFICQTMTTAGGDSWVPINVVLSGS